MIATRAESTDRDLVEAVRAGDDCAFEELYRRYQPRIAAFVIGFLQQGLRFSGLTESQVAVATGTALVVVASLRWWTTHAAEWLKNQRARRKRVPPPEATGTRKLSETVVPAYDATK
jgi:hypothetical protein